jgi:hypothetical protein
VIVKAVVVLDHAGMKNVAPPFCVTVQTGAVPNAVANVTTAAVVALGMDSLPRKSKQVVPLTHAGVPPVPDSVTALPLAMMCGIVIAPAPEILALQV